MLKLPDDYSAMEISMCYARTAITQLIQWYKSVLIKRPVFCAAAFFGVVEIFGKANATEVAVSDWSAFKSAIGEAVRNTKITLTSNIVSSFREINFSGLV